MAFENERVALLRELGTHAGREAIHSPNVLSAMERVPRHCFVPEGAQAHAYDDRALPIGLGQTISQPYVVASMTEALDLAPRHDVLEIGTGCGYQTAILAEMARRVFTIEYHRELGDAAARRLAALGYGNIEFHIGDGFNGWPGGATAAFDRIIVTCRVETIPPLLLAQLAPSGRMVIPVGGENEQQLRLVTRDRRGVNEEALYPVRFVPMLGRAEGKGMEEKSEI